MAWLLLLTLALSTAVSADPEPAAVTGTVKLSGKAKHPLLVYVEGNGPTLETGHDALIAQRGMQFDPDLLVVPVGTRVDFSNFDSEFHHVYSESGANEFEIPKFGHGQTGTSGILDQPGIVDVQCKEHIDMFAQILVVPNAWFAEQPADANMQATFEISGIAPGERTVVLWSPGHRPVERTVTFEPGESVNLGSVSLKKVRRLQVAPGGVPPDNY